ncbi:hypothetical protein [Cutibacterium modestum]|uniref:Uncharacterized protein n=2 Tax=Cutibacterium modestum TaxID=2559073 RepID=A0AAD1NV64_9ACTN|nr:hypothetical protein [Cutibacterium modestum]EFS74338.1 hypothetical protein HMPREF9621_01257 [Cutibacterium modestum HL037PA2]EFS91966.1 hypothetical protein HMPREF9607_01832 [Cutibacterium modestum HL044PA1]EFT16230.1 hypothetical protein HMPREF9622_00684 [Cutibacterium modestum HL037PA3]EGG27765.1 hypothetical protein PA08_0452 [Cutibacterium modestum P08]BCY24815.1 hypothetical protein KB1_08050 [Cutibacterium modestum]
MAGYGDDAILGVGFHSVSSEDDGDIIQDAFLDSFFVEIIGWGYTVEGAVVNTA